MGIPAALSSVGWTAFYCRRDSVGGTTDGSAFALDARTGKALWDFPAGGPYSRTPFLPLRGTSGFISYSRLDTRWSQISVDPAPK